MGPIAALRSSLSKFFRWRGRAARSEFWWFFLFYWAAFIGLVIYSITKNHDITPNDAGPVLIYMLVFALPLFAVMARRLHDKGLTAWLLLLSFVPFGQIALLILAALPGDRGPNAHGPDPLGRTKDALAYGSSRIPTVKDD